MLSSHFKILFRRLWKKRSFSLLNIIGLSVGIAASLLIFLVIRYETGYDAYQSKYNRVYRIVTTYSRHANGEPTGHESAVPLPLGDAMRLDFPQLENVAPVWNIGGAQIHVPGKKGLEDEKIFKENEGLFFLPPSFFDIFDFHWLDGNAVGLKDPNTAVLAESVANTFFGNWKNAVGKTIQIWSFRVPLRITGVFKDLPANTNIQVRMGGSYATEKKLSPNDFTDPKAWGNTPWPSECFVSLPPNQNLAPLKAQLPGFVQKYFPTEQVKGSTLTSLDFEPLKDMHLNETFYTYKRDALTHKELWSLGLIGAFLLIVACINFINLATAQSVNRAREIGVRKVLGSSRHSLISQFLQETALITFASLIVGCLLAWATLPLLAGLMGKPLSLDLAGSPAVLLFLAFTGVSVTLLAGFYPGMMIASFNPITAIKSKISVKTIGGISLRRGLVVLQFLIAQLLVIGTMVVIRQMQFFRNQPMGFEKKAVAMIDLPSDSLDRLQYDYLKSQILKVPGVSAASYCMDAPAGWGAYTSDFFFSSDPLKKDFNVAIQFADTSYLSTFRIGLVAGRIPYPLDTLHELIVNEALVNRLGLRSPEDILGKSLRFVDNPIQTYTVVGVMHNFNNKSLKDPLMPLVIAYNPNNYGCLAFRMDAERMKASLDQVHKIFSHLYPYYIYDLTFLDERVDSFYSAQLVTSSLFKVFAFLAIFISCLGLYGLISFMAVQKTKEVGIRKVLGASVQNIVYLFSREFTLLILVAFVIAAPLAYYFMDRWLSDFYYHIRIGWGVFVLAITLSIVIAWITVGYKAVMAAIANPVKSLRTE